MTDVPLPVLVRRAREGTVTAEDANLAAAILATVTDESDRYDAVFVIGRAAATAYEDTVASFIESPREPMLARLALEVLCSWWGLTRKYRGDVLRFVGGVDWDLEDGGFVRQVAISAAGEHVREHGDAGMLRALLTVFDSQNTTELDREVVYQALLRSAGMNWKETLAAGKPARSGNVDQQAIEELRRRVTRS